MLYNIFLLLLPPNSNNNIMFIEKIGTNAGLVWKALEKGEASLKAVKKATKLNEKDLNMALGWLAREGKIELFDVEGDLFARLS